MIRTISLLLFTFVCLEARPFTILIDPGHGGGDHGASRVIKRNSKTSVRIYEKDLALQISKKIYAKLKNNYNVFLTRSIDRAVSLEERAEMAEKIKADIFISIHINSSPNKKSHGYETYYLDNHTDAVVKRVEEIENKNLSGEALVVNKILTDLVVERTVGKSKKLATSIHNYSAKALKRNYRVKDRGVKPGLFYVLVLSKRPSALIEIGFLSNKNELKKMMGPKFQNSIANYIVKGIVQYYKSNKKKGPSLF